ncbi:MAG: GlsB/YeaQ/YmgE family stress response membrane protein [Ktedonobacterales bacterium]|nr:GlsB/YeaQ/YmgE family stress response membrane protein [Ktedonobacterales bacterium]
MHLAVGAALAAGGLDLNPGGCVSWAFAGLLAGWLAGHVVRGRGFGCLGDILLGLIGAALGAFVMSRLPLGISGSQGFVGTLTIAFLGALALSLIGRLVGGKKTRRYEWTVRVGPRTPPPPPPER